jgi:flagellar biosynthesis protein FliP
MSRFIIRDSSQVVAAQGDKILFLSSFSHAPTFENSENAASKPLRRKEFGKTEALERIERCLSRPAFLC